MPRFNLFLVLLLLLTKSSYAQINATVPFQNINLPPNEIIQANYAFGTNAMIFCYTQFMQNAGTINWPYKGTRPSAPLPTLLKTNAIYQGEFADGSGTLTIQNDQKVALLITCDFGF